MSSEDHLALPANTQEGVDEIPEDIQHRLEKLSPTGRIRVAKKVQLEALTPTGRVRIARKIREQNQPQNV